MLAKAPKKTSVVKLFLFCDLKTQKRYILEEAVTISKTDLSSVVDSLRGFLKTFDKARTCLQIPLPKPKIEIGSTESEGNLFAQYYKKPLNIQLDIIVHRSELETTNMASFPSKILNHTAIKKFSQKLSILTIAQFTISTRTDITLKTIVK